MSLPHTYDALFERYGKELPVAFLRSLAKGESDFDSSLSHPTGSKATGLLQVATPVLEDYNRAFASAPVTHEQLFNPETNVKVACWYLNSIHHLYRMSGLADLRPNWDDPRWVILFTLGWNAGPSRTRGVIGVVKWIRQTLNPSDLITGDQVVSFAQKAGGVAHLRPPSGVAKLRWCKYVTYMYLDESGLKKRNPLLVLLLLGLGGLGGYMLFKSNDDDEEEES
jgi:soluble lytic murein transglycosylase-like protein